MTQLRQRYQHYTLPGTRGLQLQAVLDPPAQEPVQEQPLAGATEFVLFSEQLLPQRQKYGLEYDVDRVDRENLPIQTFKFRLIESTESGSDTQMPFAVFVSFDPCLQGSGSGLTR